MPATISKNVGAKYDLWLMILGYNNHICRCLPLSSISIFRKFSFQPTRHSIFGQVRRQPQIQFIATQSACVEGPTFSNKNEVSAFPPTIPFPFFFFLAKAGLKCPPAVIQFLFWPLLGRLTLSWRFRHDFSSFSEINQMQASVRLPFSTPSIFWIPCI